MKIPLLLPWSCSVCWSWPSLRWCFLPHGRLPRFRVRYMRIRLRLRLHPGRGHASVFELWLRWGRLAAFRRSGRVRAVGASVGAAAAAAGCIRCSWAGRITGTGCGCRWKSTCVVMAPPRKGKTGLLAKLILHYPGPVVSTTTKHDVFAADQGGAVAGGPGAGVQPAGGRRGAVDVPVEPGRRVR